MKTFRDFSFEINNREVLRLLTSGNTKVPETPKAKRLLETIEDYKKKLAKLIESKGIFTTVLSKGLKPARFFANSEKTILAVCTIGPKLEVHATNLLANNDLANGVIVDAIASEAAEGVAESFQKLILEDQREQLKGKQITKRFSPGYCSWELAQGQKMIFSLVPGEEIGVRLSESMMMLPRKSISFAINIGEKVDLELGTRECSSCSSTNCKYRRNNRI